MRLSSLEINAIKTKGEKIFGSSCTIYLFGSRVNDELKGGDIDLFIETNEQNDLIEKKIQFLIEVKTLIGDQKIDLVIAEDSDRLIEKEARRTGVKL